jgi:hypothetical protein
MCFRPAAAFVDERASDLFTDDATAGSAAPTVTPARNSSNASEGIRCQISSRSAPFFSQPSATTEVVDCNDCVIEWP